MLFFFNFLWGNWLSTLFLLIFLGRIYWLFRFLLSLLHRRLFRYLLTEILFDIRGNFWLFCYHLFIFFIIFFKFILVTLLRRILLLPIFRSKGATSLPRLCWLNWSFILFIDQLMFNWFCSFDGLPQDFENFDLLIILLELFFCFLNCVHQFAMI